MPPKRKAAASELKGGDADTDLTPTITPVRSSPLKRGSDAAAESEFTPKKRRTSKKERSADDPHDPENNLVDSLRPGLILVICGLNPGLQTAATGTMHSYHLLLLLLML
jgi:hypothetical protein